MQFRVPNVEYNYNIASHRSAEWERSRVDSSFEWVAAREHGTSAERSTCRAWWAGAQRRGAVLGVPAEPSAKRGFLTTAKVQDRKRITGRRLAKIPALCDLVFFTLVTNSRS
jgi:hypothetical protein